MVNKRYVFVPALIAFWIVTASFGLAQSSSVANLGVRIRTERNSYILGEAVPVTIEIRNRSSEVLYLSEDSGISIWNVGGKPVNYVGPSIRDFTVDGVEWPIKIGPHEVAIRQKTILWNLIPETSHLNQEAAKPIFENRILTAYAFPNAGTYFVRAAISIRENNKVFESEPIKIHIAEPLGKDLEVWNRIKGSGEIAYFMQEGDMTRGYKKPEERVKFEQEIAEILRVYPNSIYAKTLRQSLLKLHASEARRQDFMQNVLRQKPE